MQTDIDRLTAEDLIRTKFIKLMRLGLEHGIPIDHLMCQALKLADVEPPHIR
jgi:hypothetical protein